MTELFASLLIWFVEGTLCGTSSVSSPVISPAKKFKLQSYAYDCGATTGYSTHVAVNYTRAGDPTGIGNVMSTNGMVDLTLTWINDSHFEVTSNEGTKRFEVAPAFIGLEVKIPK